MSAPIDELLIAVRIEHGSNLMDLYEMLKKIQDSGGKIDTTLPSWFSHQSWNGLIKRLENIKDVCKSLEELIPQTKEAIQNFISEISTNIVKNFIDGVVTYFDVSLFDHLENYRLKLNEMDSYIKASIMAQLSSILEQLKNIEIDDKLFKDIERRIQSLRNLMQEYGKKITEIKNVVKDFKFDELVKDNKELLEQIIENKKEFEPKIIDILEKIEQLIKTTSSETKDYLEQYIRESVGALFEYMPMEFNDWFLRVLQQIEKSEGNIIDRLGEEAKPRRERIDLRGIELQPYIEEAYKKEDLDIAVSTMENQVGGIIEELETKLNEIERIVNEMVRYSTFDEFRRKVYEFFDYAKENFYDDLKIFGMENLLFSLLGEFKEFNKERRWQKVMKDTVDNKFDSISNNLKELMIQKFEEEFTQLYDVLNVLTGVQEETTQTEEELREVWGEKYGDPTLVTTTDLYNMMEKIELQMKEPLQERTDIEYKLSTQERILETIDDKLDDALDALDDINPRGDEAQRTLDDDREKAGKRREGPL